MMGSIILDTCSLTARAVIHYPDTQKSTHIKMYMKLFNRYSLTTWHVLGAVLGT